MRYFFQDKQRQSALQTEADRWLGTPFFHGGFSIGHGVDCVRYAVGLMQHAGAFPAIQFPRYTLDHAKHTTRSQLLHCLLDDPALAGRLVFAPIHGPRLPGDLYGCRSGHADHHLAVHLPWNRVTHAVETQGVIIHDAGDEEFRKRVLYILRPVEVRA